MKKLYSLLAVLLISFGAMATQYCHTPIQSGDNTVYLTCLSPSEGNYTIIVEGTGIIGAGGSFCYVNENQNHQLNAEGNFVLAPDGSAIFFPITSTTDPKFYTPLYIMMPGEVAFQFPEDVEWVAECGETVEPIAEALTILFKDNGGEGDSSSSLKEPAIEDVIAEGAELVASLTDVSNVYLARAGRGLKLGTSSKAGTITLNLAQAQKMDKIGVVARRYNDKGENLLIVDGDTLQLSAEGDGEEYILDRAGNEVESIAISSVAGTSRAYVLGINLYPAEGGDEPQPQDEQMLNNPIGADGRFIVKWDCEKEQFAEANDFEVDETFTFAIDITGTVYEDFVKQTSAEGATRAIAVSKWSNYGDFNGDAVRLLPIKDNIYGATVNLYQQGLAGIKDNAAKLDSVLYVYAQVFCYEYTESNPGSNWWLWPIDVQTFQAVGSDCMFATLPYTGTKTSPEFKNSDLPGLFEEYYPNVPGYGAACAELDQPVDPNYPTVAAPDLADEYERVAPIYSDRYGNAESADFYPNWGQSTQIESRNIDGDNYIYYSNFNYQGWQFAPVMATGMKYLHLAVWSLTDGSIDIVPIYGGPNLTTDDTHRFTLNLKAGEWTEFNLDLEESFKGHDFSSIFQFKFDTGKDVTTFAIDNVYFYNPEQAIEDTEEPADLKVEVASVGYFDATLKLSATDNSGVVYYGAFLWPGSETEEPVLLGVTVGVSGAEVSLKLSDLATNTEYSNVVVIAQDEAENFIMAQVPTFRTLAGPTPAPAPTQAAENVISLYSDAYFAATWFNIGSWGQSTQANEVELAEGDNAYMLTNFNYLGWEINGNVAAFDASDMTHLHLDVWAPDADAKLNVTPIWGSEASTSVGELKAGWNQIDMPLTTWTGINLANIIQIKFDGGNGGTLFLDNIYFWKDKDNALVNVEDMSIRVNAGDITINAIAGEPITIYNVAGQMIYNTVSTGTNHISLPQGQVVIVRIADKAAKVVL